MRYLATDSLFVAVCMTALVACQPKALPMTPEETKRVEALTANMTPRCIGRHMIDLPEVFVLNSEADAEIEGVRLTVTAVSKVDFEMLFEATQTKLARQFQIGKNKNLPHLRRIIPLPSRTLGGVFDRAESDATGRGSRKFEAIGWRDGFQINAAILASDYSFPEYADDPIAKQLKSDVDEKLALLLKIFERVRGRTPTEQPQDPGLCIANGFVRGPAQENEQVNISFHLKDSPDVFFDFNHWTSVRAAKSLMDRKSIVEKDLATSGSKTIRAGKREIQGLPYEEWLVKGPTPDRVPGNTFTLNGNETANEPTKPFVEFRLFNGLRIPARQRTMEESAQLKDLKKASFTDAEAISIWDKVTPTLRPRPGAL
jgi:Tle cognate immunity protein 4 C-terminal domain/Tle cognate immunity protein 4 N-terminal domain